MRFNVRRRIHGSNVKKNHPVRGGFLAKKHKQKNYFFLCLIILSFFFLL